MYKKEIKYILPYLSPTEMLKFFTDVPANRALNGKNLKAGDSVEIEFLSTFDYLSTIPRKYLYHSEYGKLYHNTALKIVPDSAEILSVPTKSIKTNTITYTKQKSLSSYRQAFQKKGGEPSLRTRRTYKKNNPSLKSWGY